MDEIWMTMDEFHQIMMVLAMSFVPSFPFLSMSCTKHNLGIVWIPLVEFLYLVKGI
jgi:hypothetical protein